MVQNDQSYFDYDMFESQKKEDTENISEKNKDMEIEIMTKNAQNDESKPKNPKILKALYEDLITNNDQLKFEYIEMVRRGKEHEHMVYLLQGI